MKRYDHYDVVTNEEHDDWVPASVAQALYDALVYLRDECTDIRGIDMDDYIQDALRDTRKALSLADGETE